MTEAMSLLRRFLALFRPPRCEGRWTDPAEYDVQPHDPAVLESAVRLAICQACGRSRMPGACAACRLAIERDAGLR